MSDSKTGMKPGSLKPILYYENAKGKVMLFPTDEITRKYRTLMGKMGFELFAAETLDQCQKLEKRLQDALYREQQAELERDEMVTEGPRERRRQRLYARMNSAATPEVEKEFLRLYLMSRDQKHDMFKQRFTEQSGYIHILNWDNPQQHIQDLLEKT